MWDNNLLLKGCNSFLQDSNSILWDNNSFLQSRKLLLQCCNSLLWDNNSLLQDCNSILQDCKLFLWGCNSILRDSNSLLQGILDLIKDKKELLSYEGSFLLLFYRFSKSKPIKTFIYVEIKIIPKWFYC